VKILLAGSEMTPFAKTGGLGDVVGALSGVLSEFGHDVTCCVPFYRCVRETANEAKPIGLTLSIPLGDKVVTGDILEMRLAERLRVLFVRREEFYDRSELYHTGERAYEDNVERFLFFSKVVVELLGFNRFKPDVVHCHDWQTAFVPVQVAYRRQTRGPEFDVKTVFTIHNIAYQGIFSGSDFTLTNLPSEFFAPSGLEFYGQMNLMKGGIVFSDAITTVSKKYAEEILTPEGGFGLDPVLEARQEDLVGILNGADYRMWNPAADPVLKQKYGPADLSGKRACRAGLLQRFQVEASDSAPVAAVVSRLTELKGVDILAEAMEGLLKLGVTVVVLGKGAEKYERLFLDLAERFPRRVGVRIEQSEEWAHWTQAGADLLLMPSKFEPCGLTQMYALKYGTIPVVHATGGLDDTISQFDPDSGEGNGFKFAEYSPDALVTAVRQAAVLYKQPKTWQRLMRNAMACDFSWRTSAKEYEKLYASLL
jgi:starch synthase